jgi:hypothetical protein
MNFTNFPNHFLSIFHYFQVEGNFRRSQVLKKKDEESPLHQGDPGFSSASIQALRPDPQDVGSAAFDRDVKKAA